MAVSYTHLDEYKRQIEMPYVDRIQKVQPEGSSKSDNVVRRQMNCIQCDNNNVNI